ncbi:MAG: sigma-54-dependent Fis family transcriptional regulator [Saprospiraceae bacterium]|jgi:transcriptional regulator with PAS, ATPase and Fis domain|uniref:sigma-54 interaction domain-containing protein n=1 Tax=Candidatus Brachybacter algidus TaxID=2982024 RepID=UPI001B694213|nr:sigma-54 dependent transcriptional regulator [Candidatus Brachybacter algidus]MBP7307108.1 sigma-54-dependent Fis family transcriptional regulator [Saprospiraceae bacterium]MBK6448112.1 sigma-54-dependent Fis family transcriptional regulator [Candidatus Brachybacter algidus]MBK7602925.1 sigma-54-dependent Fis family transcriptional regulator [Candidatus Brachybacter algidus]MBK8602038.1 sigma-54-dependent Fis family transcriptional regulator [Candidatus Brachybacter algidus]MBK8749349.1 sig
MTLQSIKLKFGILGVSASLDNALNTAVRVAPTDLTVLISGESGVGKEVFSKVIHSLSPRKHNPFIAINCGAIPEGTINSELFGHEKGAFTGALGDRKGYFETVDGGTIFLDEIGEMPMDTQAFLLRVLESGEFIRVGSSKSQKTDVRVIAATNVNLEDLIKKGKFREDLYFRLSIVPIRVPSLKDRREDIRLLFRKFAVDFSEKYNTNSIQLTDQSQAILENYSWPGNIRELRNVTEQLSVLAEEKIVTPEILLKITPQLANRNLPSIVGRRDDENMSERDILYKLLFEMKGDVNDLKALVFELISRNQLSVGDMSSFRQLGMKPASDNIPVQNYAPTNQFVSGNSVNPKIFDKEDEPTHQAYFFSDNDEDGTYQAMEEVSDSLSLEVMEKDMIIKALKKYNSRRKEAAKELGLSERTLYRKIKQYDIDQ